MALIKWSPNFVTGIDIIDQQHRMLVDLMNELSEAHEAGKDRQLLVDLIKKLGVYAATHFAQEEEIFKANNISEYEFTYKEIILEQMNKFFELHDYFVNLTKK